jgi:hypothetical protein
MALQDEIDVVRQQISTDSYQMSIGELMNLYESGEMDLHPEFQRFFRWSSEQKSKLIESILMGIPLPPIFVSQRDDGLWDVIDGLQRLSTVFEVAGILKNELGERLPQLRLVGTPYLPSLGGKTWGREDEDGNAVFSITQRLLIKRARMGVTIVNRESDQKSKFELFQRLNTGGTPLSEQETRNCMMVMLNRQRFEWIKSLATSQDFLACLPLTQRQIEEQYPMELILRLISLKDLDHIQLLILGDVGDSINKKTLEICQDEQYPWQLEGQVIQQLFLLLSRTMESDAFRKYQPERNRFIGGFSIAGYEAVTCGVFAHLDFYINHPDEISVRVMTLWGNAEFIDSTGGGIRASQRIPRTIPLARRLFTP